MAELFSGHWMKAFMDAWNNDPQMVEELGRAGFTSIIGFGFDTEELPRVVVVVNQGKAATVGGYHGEALEWDLRAPQEQWQTWREKPPNLMGLGLAYTQRRLRFRTGNYASMIKDPRLAAPFVRCFSVIASVK